VGRAIRKGSVNAPLNFYCWHYWKHSELMFEKKKLIPSLEELPVSQPKGDGVIFRHGKI
jgi:hypothetical protein